MLVLLWIYFFHIALYHTTIALTVSNSYFQGDLQEHHLCPSLGGFFGAPMLVSLASIFRYHLGSLAFGSLALMICTVGRVVFEYVERHTKDVTKELRQSLAFERDGTNCNSFNSGNVNLAQEFAHWQQYDYYIYIYSCVSFYLWNSQDLEWHVGHDFVWHRR